MRISLFVMFLFCNQLVGAALDGNSHIEFDAQGNYIENFMPKNDLWKEDNYLVPNNMSKEKFMEIINIGKSYYLPIAKQKKETLTVKPNWDDATVNASASRLFGTVTINMYGGLARRPEVTPDAFALVLCHELGHAYGGTPLANALFKLAAEGQADWYGSKTCLKKVFTKLAIDRDTFATTAYMEDTCRAKTANLAEEDESTEPSPAEETDTNEDPDYMICLRIMAAGQSVGNLFTTMKKEESVDFETPDKTEVSESLKSYPATIQCRLDTYFAGALDRDRPLCWWKPGSQEDDGVMPPEEGEEIPPETGGDNGGDNGSGDNGGGDDGGFPFPWPFPFPFPEAMW